MKKIIKRVYKKISKSWELKKFVNKLETEQNISKRFAKIDLKSAKKMKFALNEYLDKGLYDLTLSEKEEYLKYKKMRKEAIEKSYEFYVDIAVMRSGLSASKIKHDMELVRLIGISNLKYVQNGVWTFNDEQRKDLADFLSKDKERINKNKKRYISLIMEKTGWKRGKVELEILKSRVCCGASYEDYYAFKLYQIPLEKHVEYVTLDMFDKMRLKYNEHFEAQKFFDDKGKFNETFADLIDRKWFTNKDLSYEQFEKNIAGLKYIFVKPISATKGEGIQKFECSINKKERKKLYNKLTDLPESIVEEYIVQHKDVMKFCPTSVNTIRITTLYYNGKCEFLYAVFRMGRGEVVDNFHAGGIAAPIDIKTGTVISNAADLDGNIFSVNPYSGLTIKGFKIPNWNKIIAACKKATGRVENVCLVGWDFAITEKGVDLIEGNPGVSYILAQVPNVEGKIGLSSVMVKPYLGKYFNYPTIK